MKDMIYCQRDIPKEQWRYGFRSSAATGCGWIAVYNALHLMGLHEEPEALIQFFHRTLPLIHGNAGTMFWAPALYFLRRDFPIRMCNKPSQYDDLAKEYDCCILYYHWRNKLRFGSHFVALHHTEEGFIGYNTYSNSKGPDRYGPSLADFLKRRRYHGTILLCIRKPAP